jgi:hypothetical protein
VSQVEAVRLALAEIGDASNEAIAGHVLKVHGLDIRPAFVPVLKASVRDKENLEAWKRRAAEAGGQSEPT